MGKGIGMKGAIDERKEISPIFPRLHIKDLEKGGPKSPPTNKMALYEQFGRKKGQKHLPNSL